MILMGVMQKTRKSWRMLLEESLHLMREQRMDEFGQAVILYLVNHAKMDKTKNVTHSQAFVLQDRWRSSPQQNKSAMKSTAIVCFASPMCRFHSVKSWWPVANMTVFTLPHENANFALQCPDMEYAQIANADHVPQLQRRKETMHLFATFLKDESIQHLDGIIPFSRAQMLEMERRGEERVQIQHPETFLSYRHSDLVIATEVVDLNYFGVLLRFESDFSCCGG